MRGGLTNAAGHVVGRRQEGGAKAVFLLHSLRKHTDPLTFWDFGIPNPVLCF